MDKEKKKKIRTKSTDKYETYSIGTCENCGKENVKIRPVEAYSAFARASRESSRGFYKLCFECFKPRVKFKGRDGRIYEAPTNIICAPEGLVDFQGSAPSPQSEEEAKAVE